MAFNRMGYKIKKYRVEAARFVLNRPYTTHAYV